MNRRYHDYVYSFEERRFRGDFEGMYQNEERERFDSWFQEDVTHIIRKVSVAVLERYNFGRVLDIGCGKGTFTHLLKKQNNVVKGVDISATAIQKARIKYPSIEFEEFRVEDLHKLSGDPYDLVAAMALLYYVETWPGVLETLSRLGKYLYVTLYLPPDTLGFIPSIEAFLDEAGKHFRTETEIVLNRHSLCWLGASKKLT